MNQVGISDLLSYRDCPRRASYSMRRHVGTGVQSVAATPEAGSKASAYGSAFHDAVSEMESGAEVRDAILAAWQEWGHALGPLDFKILTDDLEAYQARDFQGVRTILNEDEIRVPVSLHDGRVVFFRARIDRLYERLDHPGHFIHVDYKTSRWPKSETEVQDDLQMWAYQWALYEWLPEAESIVTVYDQLRAGQVRVRKSQRQREMMRDWLAAEMATFFDDQRVQDDGLLPPRLNRWCAYCEILESCPVIPQLTDWAQSLIGAIRYDDPEVVRDYIELYSDAKRAASVLDKFTSTVKDAARELPENVRDELGLKVRPRRQRKLGPESLARLRDRIGDEAFFELVSVPQSRLDSLDEDARAWALEQMEQTESTWVSTEGRARK